MVRISIVLPNFNSIKYLRECIEAFLGQDYSNKRLVIVDAKSTDSSHEIIERYAEENEEVEWIRQEDKGLSDAINVGLKCLENDEIFGFLGADDILLQGTLTKVADFMEEHPEATGVFFDSYSQNPEGKQKFRHCPSKTMAMTDLLRYRTVAGLQNTYLRSKIVKAYGFNTAAKYSMDYELYLRLARDGLGEKIFHISHPSTININSGNISTVFRRDSKREALKFGYGIAPFGWRKIRIGLRLLR